jgi:hypothetical protein
LISLQRLGDARRPSRGSSYLDRGRSSDTINVVFPTHLVLINTEDIMMSIAKVTAGLLFVLTGWFAVFAPPPDGCRLKVINTGVAGFPNYGTTTCVGDCTGPAGNPCDRDVYAGTYTEFQCKCDGQDLDTNNNVQGCIGSLTNLGGSWTIICENVKCVAKCLKADLPGPGQSVWACTCPDAP